MAKNKFKLLLVSLTLLWAGEVFSHSLSDTVTYTNLKTDSINGSPKTLFQPQSETLDYSLPSGNDTIQPTSDETAHSTTQAGLRSLLGEGLQRQRTQDRNTREMLLVAIPITIATLTILLAMVVWNRRLQREIEEREIAEQRLRDSEARLLDSQSIANVGSWVWDIASGILTWSQETYAILGVSPAQYQPNIHSFLRFIYPKDRDKVQGTLRDVLEGTNDEYNLEYRLLSSDGKVRFAQSYGRVIRDDDNRPLQLAGVIHDITEQKRVELALREKQHTLQSLLDNAPIGIWFQGRDERLLFVNKALCEAMGVTEKEFLAASHYYDFFDSQAAMSSKSADAMAMAQEGPHISQERIRFADGKVHDLEVLRSRVVDEHGAVVGLIGLSMDITEKKQAEDKLLHQAYFDELTGLGNRNYLMEQLGRSLAQASRHKYYNALLFFDLDNFKIINDSLGHQTGDVLLKEVGRRLQTVIREEDSVARLGGDEFVLIVNELGSVQEEAAEQAHNVAEKVRKALIVPYELGSQEHLITLSIGISMFPTSNDDVNDILKHADTAMYRAKEAGRNAIRFFIPSMQEAAEERLHMQNLLRYAIPRQELRLHYQPQFNHDGELLGAECLLRWEHPELGIISPARFIPIAEDSGQIIEIGTWVLRESCQMLKIWQTQGNSSITLSVNVSPRQFHQPDYVKQVMAIISETGIDPRYLELELTESILVEHVEEVTHKMRALRAIGVRFAIDDFGTGYSSLAYLKRLPLDRLKIDQSFIRDVNNDSSDAMIVETMISMAAHLELDVIAEGVENQQQIDFLYRLGCNMYQGFFFSRPLSRKQFGIYLSHSHNRYNYLQ